jgi:4-amino-4-deoxy-L-arabinose transferase-like glycosyltransferase
MAMPPADIDQAGSRDEMQAAAGQVWDGTWLRDLAVLAVVVGLWFCGLLGMRPLGNPDEGRYTEIPREMAATGDYVTPRLNGVKYFEKPPLVYWLSALTFRQFGVNEFTARLWNGLFALGGVLMTYGAARCLYGRAAGIWAAVVLTTSLMYFVLSQIILLDMAVAVTVSGALFAFIVGVGVPRGRRRLGWFLGFYGMVALATLSKGLIGIALPGAVIFLWVLLLNRWRALWPFYPLAGTLLLLAIAAPWHVLAARANPDFVNFYFVHEHWLRFTTRVHDRYEPWWYFLPVLVVGLFPWVFFVWQAVADALAGGRKARRHRPEAWFLVIWIVFIVAFFSKSQSKLIPYILPVFPALAVLLGRFVAGVWAGRAGNHFRRGVWAFAGTAVVLAVAVGVVPGPQNQPALAAWLPVLRVMVGGALLAGAAAAFLGLRRGQPRLMLGAVALASAVFLLAINFGGGFFYKTSTKSLAMTLKPMLQADDRVYCVGYYAQDLPVYLGRLVSVVGSPGELSFGIDAEPERTAGRFLERKELAGQWAQPGVAYAVVRKNTYAKWFSKAGIPHRVIEETDGFVLAVKSPPLL